MGSGKLLRTCNNCSVLFGVAAVLALAQVGLADVFQQLSLDEIRVGGYIGRRIDATVEGNLLKLDLEGDFLQPFKVRNRGGGYIGVGKTLDAFVRLAAYTGRKDLLERKNLIVDTLLSTQEADGYIGIIRPRDRMWSLWDIHEMSYIVYALVSDYEFFGSERSLQAAEKLGDYIVRNWEANPDGEPGRGAITVHMAVTGLENAMLALYKATGKRKYLEFCTNFRRLADWQPEIVLGRWGKIEGHAYAHMCRCVAQLRLFRWLPQQKLLRPADDVVDFLLHRDGLVITGACSDHECWHDTQEGTINLGETCSSAYLVRMLDELLRLRGHGFYGDIMERTIYNTLFAAQSPDGRRIRYYTPFDGPRQYFKDDPYCCPGNFRRIIAELPTMILYKCTDGLVVNLYTDCEVQTKLLDGTPVKLVQRTKYPRDGVVEIDVTVPRPVEFALYLRIPSWCKNASVAVNGRVVSASLDSGTFAKLRRRWEANSTVRLELPMSWKFVKGRKMQAGRVAIMRGPLVFCLNRDRHDKLADCDLRLIVIEPGTIKGPFPDQSFDPEGIACTVEAWGPGAWYPAARRDLVLTLTEFPDPGGEAVYFKVPNPRDERLVDDPLLHVGPKPVQQIMPAEK